MKLGLHKTLYCIWLPRETRSTWSEELKADVICVDVDGVLTSVADSE